VLNQDGGISRCVPSQIIGESTHDRIRRSADLEADEYPEGFAVVEAAGLGVRNPRQRRRRHGTRGQMQKSSARKRHVALLVIPESGHETSPPIKSASIIQ